MEEHLRFIQMVFMSKLATTSGPHCCQHFRGGTDAGYQLLCDKYNKRIIVGYSVRFPVNVERSWQELRGLSYTKLPFNKDVMVQRSKLGLHTACLTVCLSPLLSTTCLL
ncbi:hypothetical protein J6590_082945 [Homalodisca vitripennis]|nr:hypothetical protein J6590_082945 [Homalodisca vitripennis]